MSAITDLKAHLCGLSRIFMNMSGLSRALLVLPHMAHGDVVSYLKKYPDKTKQQRIMLVRA
jgi:hypothetical protein